MVCVSPAEKKMIEDAAALVPERSAVWARKVLLDAAAAKLRDAATAAVGAGKVTPQLLEADALADGGANSVSVENVGGTTSNDL